MKTYLGFPLALLASLLLSGCIINVGGGAHNGNWDVDSITSLLGDIDVSQGRSVEDITTVNGDISLASYVTAHQLDTTNGDISIANHVEVKHAETTNGDIQAGHHFTSAGGVETVNGEIEIQGNSFVGGKVETVNGDIELFDVEVEGSVLTHNGDISLLEETWVKGDVVFEQNNNKNSSHRPTLFVAAQAKIAGRIILEREVKLHIDNPALRDKIVKRYLNK